MNKLTYKGDMNLYYYSKEPQFSLVKHYKPGEVGSLNGFTGCRETLINSVATHAFMKKKVARMNRVKFEVMIAFMFGKKANEEAQKVKARRYVQRALRLINHFESRVGWPLTRVKEVKPPKEKSSMYVLYASPRWMRNSFLISTYLLMFRAGRSPSIGKWKTHDGLMAKLKTYPAGKDASTIKNTYDKWEILMVHRDKLNKGRTMLESYNLKKVARQAHVYSIGVEGITRLCSGSTSDWLFLNRFAEVCKKEGKQIPVSPGKVMKKIW